MKPPWNGTVVVRVVLRTSSCLLMVVCRCSSMVSSSEILSWRLLSAEEDVLVVLVVLVETSVWIFVIWD